MIILITGGGGLVGSHLVSKLQNLGHEVRILTRKKKGREEEYLYTDDEAYDHVDAVIHLAGESIAGGRWTKKRKKRIIDSRVETLRFVSEKIKSCKVIIGASATGFYGGDRKEEVLTEESTLGEGFLAQCCELWEEEERLFASRHQCRLVIVRTGIVLSDKGGALPQMASPVKMGLGADLGNGKQWLSWIHIDDLTDLYIKALTDTTLSGVVNGVALEPVRYSAFNQVLAKVLKKKIVLPNIPGFILKVALGGMSVLLLGSLRVTSKHRLLFKYNDLEEALQDIYGK